jgi:hypothetical protein
MTRRQRWTPGAVFLVPLSDGNCAVGQVLRRTPGALNSVICAFYDFRRHCTDSVDISELSEKRLVAIQFTTPDLLDNSTWRVAGQGPVRHLDLRRDIETIESSDWVGAKVIGSGIIRKFLDAYYGLRSWNAWADPAYLDKLLISPDRRPVNVVLSNNPKESDR